MSEDDKKHIKESLTGRNIKFYQLYKKADTYGYLFNLVDEYKIPSLFSDNMYVYKLFSPDFVTFLRQACKCLIINDCSCRIG